MPCVSLLPLHVLSLSLTHTPSFYLSPPLPFSPSLFPTPHILHPSPAFPLNRLATIDRTMCQLSQTAGRHSLSLSSSLSLPAVHTTCLSFSLFPSSLPLSSCLPGLPSHPIPLHPWGSSGKREREQRHRLCQSHVSYAQKRERKKE